MDQPKSVLAPPPNLAPCGNVVACLRRAEEIHGVSGRLAMEGNMRCPLCREPIRATIKATYS